MMQSDSSVQNRVEELNKQNKILMSKLNSTENNYEQVSNELALQKANTSKLCEQEGKALSTSQLLQNQIENYKSNIEQCETKLSQLQGEVMDLVFSL